MDMEKPLGLPEGSVRSILALFISVVTALLVFIAPSSVPEYWSNVFIMAVTYYFASRKK